MLRSHVYRAFYFAFYIVLNKVSKKILYEIFYDAYHWEISIGKSSEETPLRLVAGSSTRSEIFITITLIITLT